MGSTLKEDRVHMVSMCKLHHQGDLGGCVVHLLELLTSVSNFLHDLCDIFACLVEVIAEGTDVLVQMES